MGVPKLLIVLISESRCWGRSKGSAFRKQRLEEGEKALPQTTRKPLTTSPKGIQKADRGSRFVGKAGRGSPASLRGTLF